MKRFQLLFSILSVAILAERSSVLAAQVSATDPHAASSVETSISRIHMLDLRNGWAWGGIDGGNLLLRTDDGGRTWRDCTPREFSPTMRGSCFLDSQRAWVFTVDRSTRQVGLLRTTDGGKSWIPLLAPGKDLMGVSSCRFADDSYGVATLADGGLSSAYYNYYETHDGGATWKPIAVIARTPDPNPVVPAGTFRLCTLSGDTMDYYPPSKVIIGFGDMPDEQPRGLVSLSLSTDRGATWRDIKFPLPDRYREGLARPVSPVFFGDRKGLLPVFIKSLRSNTYDGVLLFYSTTDGGNVWTARPGVAGFKEPLSGIAGSDFDVVSANDVFVQSGTHLYVTHDGAQSWQVINPGIDFGREGTGQGSQLDFVDAATGWWLVRNGDQNILYSTTDGGATWAQLSYAIIH